MGILYEITYENKIVQKKNLIDHSYYLELKSAIDEILATTKTDKLDSIKSDKDITKLNKDFKKEHGEEYFTTESPLGKAIHSGLLVMPEHQGGTAKCIVKKV